MSFELTGLFYREPAERQLRCHISEMSVAIPKLFLRTVEAATTLEGIKYACLVFITVTWIPVRWSVLETVKKGSWVVLISD
jgi:hypothetical protein